MHRYSSSWSTRVKPEFSVAVNTSDRATLTRKVLLTQAELANTFLRPAALNRYATLSTSPTNTEARQQARGGEICFGWRKYLQTGNVL